MLQESNSACLQTTWRWLTTGTPRVADPFDLALWDPQPPAQGPAAPNFAPTAATYQRGVGDQATLTGIHGARLAAVAGGLAPLAFNQHQVDQYKRPAVLATVAEALQNLHGPAVAVAQAGAAAVAGTIGANTCVAVLARANTAAGHWAVGAIHLSVDDMDTLAHADAAILRLHNALVAQLPAPIAACQVYAVGGNTDGDPDIVEDYARAVGACQRAQANRGMTLAGALVPASQNAGDFVDAFITPVSFCYGRGNNADYGSGSDSDDSSSST